MRSGEWSRRPYEKYRPFRQNLYFMTPMPLRLFVPRTAAVRLSLTALTAAI